MPLDDALTARIAEPDFWPRYLFDDAAELPEDEPEESEESDESDEEYRAEFGLGGGLGLVLDVELGNWVGLGLAAPGRTEPVELGWDDEAHFHPHVMRWSELDLLARAAAVHDPTLRHPGPVVALLARFVVLDEQDEPGAITPLVDAAFRAVRPGPGRGVRPETRDWYELRDLSGTGLRWTDEGRRSAVSQPDDLTIMRPLYTLRAPGSDEFPFAEWEALLVRAEAILGAVAADPALADPAVRAALERCTRARGQAQTGALAAALRTAGFTAAAVLRALEEPVSRAESCWAVETLAGAEPGSLVKRWFGRSPLAAAAFWDLTLTLPSEVPTAVAAELDAALKAADLGWAEIAGSTSERQEGGGHVTVSTVVELRVRDELARGVELTAEVLRRFGAVEPATLRHAAAPYERIALG